MLFCYSDVGESTFYYKHQFRELKLNSTWYCINTRDMTNTIANKITITRTKYEIRLQSHVQNMK